MQSYRGSSSAQAAAWRWLVPILAYALGVGLLGVFTKLALRSLSWQEMLLWVTLFYGIVGLVLTLGFGIRFGWGRGDRFAALSGFFASSGLVFLFIALDQGDAGQVIPITAAYPVLTAGVAALVLSEKVTPIRLLGTLIVIAGIVLIGVE